MAQLKRQQFDTERLEGLLTEETVMETTLFTASVAGRRRSWSWLVPLSGGEHPVDARITVDQHQIGSRDTYSYSRATSTEKEKRETKQRQEKKTPGTRRER